VSLELEARLEIGEKIMNELENQIANLLRRTGSAHGVYETSVLNGVYDQDWALWYADWALNNGLPELLGRQFEAEDFNAESFGKVLFDLNQDHQRVGQGLTWAQYTAQRLDQMFAAQGVG
jgi:hypothetical protein